MKKTLFILGIVMSLFTTKLSAQEVRGVETRLATYEGKEYELGYKNSRDNWIVFGRSSEYLGFEFTNLNSIPVSVSVEIYYKGENSDRLIDTKEIVLKNKESYICKYPTIQKYEYNSYRNSYTKSDSENWEISAELGKSTANRYYTKYKAYKLL